MTSAAVWAVLAGTLAFLGVGVLLWWLERGNPHLLARFGSPTWRRWALPAILGGVMVVIGLEWTLPPSASGALSGDPLAAVPLEALAFFIIVIHLRANPNRTATVPPAPRP